MPEKIKIAAVICEFDPLHLGHRFLLQQARKHADGVVCILGGNFLQRGELSMLDKWARCRLALENGADLVVELPLPWACAGAERFALGGVSLAAALGAVDFLVFGSEEADLNRLSDLADILLSPNFSQALRDIPQRGGDSFPRRREAAVAKLGGSAELLCLPNCILAVEYLKALKQLDTSITPIAIERVGAGHNRLGSEGEFRSAGELRAMLRKGQSIAGFVPPSTLGLLGQLETEGKFPSSVSRLESAILCKLRTMEPTDFAALPDVSEGLNNRLYKASRNAGSLEEFFTLVKTKRYPMARIRRLCLAAFLGIPKNAPALPPYLRILGKTKTGDKILRQASPSLPLAARPRDFQALGGSALSLFHLEARADDLYALSLPVPQPCGRDMTEKLIDPEEKGGTFRGI